MTYIPDPITRKEQYYNYLSTGQGILPEPITREEEYLYYLCVNGIGGGSISPEQIQQAVDNYLSENPVTAGNFEVDNHVLKIVGGTNEDT